MGDVLVKGMNDAAEEQAANNKAKGDERFVGEGRESAKEAKGRPKQNLTDEEKEALKIKRSESGKVRVDKRTIAAAKEAGFTDPNTDEDAFTSTTGPEEKDKKRYEETLEKLKELRSAYPFTPPPDIAQQIERLEDTLRGSGFDTGFKEAPEKIKDENKGVKVKPKLSRREEAMAVPGRAEEMAEVQGLDSQLLHARTLNEIKRRAREQGIPVPSEDRSSIDETVDPRYTEL